MGGGVDSIFYSRACVHNIASTSTWPRLARARRRHNRQQTNRTNEMNVWDILGHRNLFNHKCWKSEELYSSWCGLFMVASPGIHAHPRLVFIMSDFLAQFATRTNGDLHKVTYKRRPSAPNWRTELRRRRVDAPSWRTKKNLHERVARLLDFSKVNLGKEFRI